VGLNRFVTAEDLTEALVKSVVSWDMRTTGLLMDRLCSLVVTVPAERRCIVLPVLVKYFVQEF
jgi:hypothetical protein